MKKRVLSVLLTVTLLLSFGLVAPVLAAVASTPISNALTATTTGIAMNEQVTMSWSTDGTTFTGEALDLTMVVGVPVTIYVRTTSMMGEPIERVRFLAATGGDYYTIEVTDSSLPADTWRGVLTYDVTEGGYVFGPAEGFTMPVGYVATTTLSVAAKVSGPHTASVYAVQLLLP